MKHDDEYSSGRPETDQCPGIQSLNFEPYSFSISPSMHDLHMNANNTIQPPANRLPTPSWDYGADDDTDSELSPGEWDDDDDDDDTDTESSPGGWDEGDQGFAGPLSNIVARFNISPGEGTVMVDGDGGESFNDDRFFQFQEMVSVMEGFVAPDSENVNDSWVEETILDSLKTRRYGRVADDDGDDEESEICAICQGEFENEEVLATLQCGHEYHSDCITKWLIRKNACPLCNQDGYQL